MQPTDTTEQLTLHQFKLLRRLANSQVKVYCQPAGTDSDKRRDEITLDFNATLRLCELGLMSDATCWPKYTELVDRYSGEGREIVIVVLNKIGDVMFKRTAHERWTN
jgi:hypothetical protein